jgi:hypothetical protein
MMIYCYGIEFILSDLFNDKNASAEVNEYPDESQRSFLYMKLMYTKDGCI